MKRFIKKILENVGYTLITNKHFNKLAEIRNTLESELNLLITLSATNESDFKSITDRVFCYLENLTFFDIGANVGQTVKKLKNYYPASKIYAFEPVENTFRELIANTAQYKDVVPRQLAMGSLKAHIELFHQSASQLNSLSPYINKSDISGKQKSEVVIVSTVDSFAEENHISHIHFLKTDTEGFEIEVLRGASKLLANSSIDFVYVEVGFAEEDLGHVRWLKVVDELKSFDYHFCGLFDISLISGIRSYANALFASTRIQHSLKNTKEDWALVYR